MPIPPIKASLATLCFGRIIVIDCRPCSQYPKRPAPQPPASQLLEQRAGRAAPVLWSALQIGEALFQNGRFLRVGLANLRDDLVIRRAFTAHRQAVGIVVQDYFGPLQTALWLDLDLRGFP